MEERKGIEYVRYYDAGTAARKLDPIKPEKPKRSAPKPKNQRIPVPFDPVAVFGTAVAVIMLVCVIFGFGQLNHVNNQVAQAQKQISNLKSEHYTLEKRYNAGINLEEIRTTAKAMGLVPLSEVRHITIALPQPEPVVELPWWQELWQDFKAMFE